MNPVETGDQGRHNMPASTHATPPTRLSNEVAMLAQAWHLMLGANTLLISPHVGLSFEHLALQTEAFFEAIASLKGTEHQQTGSMQGDRT